MPKAKLTRLGIVRVLTVVVGLAGVYGCSNKPSNLEVEQAIRNLLPKKVPTELFANSSVSGDAFARCQIESLHETQIKEIRVLEIGEPWTNPPPYANTHYPVKVWVDGLCIEGGEHHPIRGEMRLNLLHNYDGSWVVAY